MNFLLSTPVLFIASARPRSTRLVFDAIRKTKPKKLYVSVDAPAPGSESLRQRHAEVLDIVSAVDWPCELETRFTEAEGNAAYTAVPAALDWFFSHEPEGIILDDDCLPEADFFLYCQTLLSVYRDDPRVRHISGTNLQFGVTRGNASYYFGRIPAVWGWAGWRRTWKDVCLEMKTFPAFKESGLIYQVINEAAIARRLEKMLQSTYEARIRTWGYQYGYSILINNGLCIHPNVNLVSRFGTGMDDKPGKTDHRAIVALPCRPMVFPLTHPKTFVPDIRADVLQVSWTFDDNRTDVQQRMLSNANLRFHRIENQHTPGS